MNIEEVVIFYGDDWKGLYVNGDLRAEGHSLATFHVLDALGIPYRELNANDEFFDEHAGRCPESLAEAENTKGIS